MGGGGQPERVVLVVEDEPYIAFGYRALLEERGYTVLCVDKSSDAIDIARSRIRLACMIADLKLRDGDVGSRVVAEIRELHPDLPVCIISGHDTKGLGSDCEVIAKPARFEKILDFVERAVA